MKNQYRPLRRKAAAPSQTALQAFEKHKAEALRRIKLIEAAILAQPLDKAANDWGYAGSMVTAVSWLGNVGHVVGVAELTEK